MVRMEVEFPFAGHALGFREIRSPTFENCNPSDGASHGPAHSLPFYRRAGMKYHTVAEALHDLVCRHHVHQDGCA